MKFHYPVINQSKKRLQSLGYYEARAKWPKLQSSLVQGARDCAANMLKREKCDRWLTENCDPATDVVYVGIDWSEVHRFDRLRERRAADGWTYKAPLCDAPYLTKDDLHDWATREGLRKQRLYVLGMPHANCGGGCVKMGQGGFARKAGGEALRAAPA